MNTQEITRLQAIAQQALDGITMGGVDFARQSLVKIVEGLKAAAPHPPAQQAAISDEALREIYFKHALAGAMTLSDLRSIAVDVLAMASPPPHKAEGAEQ